MVFGKFPPPRYDRLATTDHAGATPAADYSKLAGIAAGAGTALPNVSVSNSVVTSIPNGAWTLLTFDTDVVDTNGFHDPATNPERITIPAGLDGIYLISVNIMFASNTTGARYLAVKINDANYDWSDNRAPVSGNALQMSITFHKRMVAGDYLVGRVFQDSGGALNLFANNLTTGAPYQLSMTRLCP